MKTNLKICWLLILLVGCSASIVLEKNERSPKNGEYNLNIDNIELHYKIQGKDDAQPIIIIPCQTTANDTLYQEYIADSLANYKVITYDLRGYGKSSELTEDDSFSIGRLAEDVEALREELQLGNFTILAHGSGVFIALKYYVEHPQHVHKLILVDGGYTGPKVADVLGINNERLFYNKKHHPQVEPADFPPGISTKVAFAYYNFDFSEMLFKIKAPTLIITGRYSEVWNFNGQSKKMETQITDSEFLEYKKSGHFPFIEENSRFIADIEHFLAASH